MAAAPDARGEARSAPPLAAAPLEAAAAAGVRDEARPGDTCEAQEVHQGGFCDDQRQRGERAGVDLDVVVSDVDKKGEMADPTWMPTDVVVRNVDKKGEWLCDPT